MTDVGGVDSDDDDELKPTRARMSLISAKIRRENSVLITGHTNVKAATNKTKVLSLILSKDQPGLGQ